MKKKVIVLSLGGSLIIPDDIDVKYLKELKKVLLSKKNKYKFIIVCGGGSTARKYINGLRIIGADKKLQSLIGMEAIKLNSKFMSYFFEKKQKEKVHNSLKSVEKASTKRDIIFCGALEYNPNMTSDGTAAEIASYFKSPFINLTDVKGLFNKNPKKHKDAKLIPKISWEDFDKMASKLSYYPGQHFVLDQSASKIIKKHKISTYIIGKDLRQLDNFLDGKKFIGTIING